MSMNSDDLFRLFDDLGVSVTTHEHAPTFTVDEGRELKAKLPGGHSKNLFMKDKAGQIVLISAHADAELKLNRLHKHIGTGRLSFASKELMEEKLGVLPGSVTAFALANESAAPVRFILEKTLAEHDVLNFHPLRNDMTIAIARADFDRFIAHTGRTLDIIDFATLE